MRFAGGDARGIDPAHLPGADAHGGQVPGIDNGVRLHVLGHAEAKDHVGELALVRLTLADDLQGAGVHPAVVATLH